LPLPVYACRKHIPYVQSKFIQQEAVGIYHIYLGPLKKIAAQNLYTSLSARNSQKLCSLHSQQAKASKNELQTNILYVLRTIDIYLQAVLANPIKVHFFKLR